jgi:hypothetical protein
VEALDHRGFEEAGESFEPGFGRRLRGAHERAEVDTSWGAERAPIVTLGAATQIELDGREVRFLVPFTGQRPNEHWLHAFRGLLRDWPLDLQEPRLDEGRGLYLGPLPVDRLDQYVEALKSAVDEASRVYTDEIEPELRRQREEALRREEEERRLRVDVESRLKALLG